LISAKHPYFKIHFHKSAYKPKMSFVTKEHELKSPRVGPLFAAKTVKSFTTQWDRVRAFS